MQTNEIMVLMKRNEMGEHRAEIVDGDDLREVNEALDWIQETPVYLAVHESKAMKTLVYVEVDAVLCVDERTGRTVARAKALTMAESETFIYDALYEVEKAQSKPAVAS
ncbi:MAG: hypothetical protein RIC84_08640 [Aggregatilineales bacterium]